MRKFIRLEPRRFLYIVEPNITVAEREHLLMEWNRVWDDAMLVVITAEEYIDASGQAIETIHRTQLRGEA